MANFHFDLVSPERLVFSGEVEHVVVGGGFAEVAPEGLTVLAELAVPVEEFDRSQLVQEIKDTEEDLVDAKDDALRDKMRRRLDQLNRLELALGERGTRA